MPPTIRDRRRRPANHAIPWRCYRTDGTGHDALCEQAPKPQAWLDPDGDNDLSPRRAGRVQLPQRRQSQLTRFDRYCIP